MLCYRRAVDEGNGGLQSRGRFFKRKKTHHFFAENSLALTVYGGCDISTLVRGGERIN